MPLAPETRLGPYQIISMLGVGGMGEVYRARDTRLGRDVAVKILPEHVASDGARVARFEHEARAAGALNHPNIVVLYDIGTDAGVLYMVTELVDGEPLRALMQHGPVAVRRTIDIATQIADGLAAAHAAALAHRDLKPENIMITRDGRVKILDFGLARQTTSTTTAADATVAMTRTEPGMVVGTVAYMSPEQVRGIPADGRSDIFSFGVIMHEMLAGRRAFAGATNADTMSAILREDAPELPVAAPAALQAIVRHCLEKEPEARFQSARDLSFGLKALAGGSGATTAVAARPEPGVRRRHWLPAAIAVVALAAGVALGLRFAPRGGVDLDRYRFVPLATEGTRQTNPAWSADGRRIAYARMMNEATQIFVRDLSAPTPAQLTNSPQNCSHPFWSADGTRVYYVVGPFRRPAKLYSTSVAGGEPELVLDRVLGAALSPDCKTLAALRPAASGDARYELILSSPTGSEPRPYPGANLHVPGGQAFVRFAPNGRTVLVYNFNGKSSEFRLVPIPPGQPRQVLPALSSVTLLWSMSWMPDSRRVVLAYETGGGVQHLHLADPATGDVRTITSGTEYDLDAAVAPDGKKLAVTIADFDYDLISLPLDGSGVRVLKATTRDESAPAWCPTRAQYAYTTNRTGRFEIWLASPQEESDRPLVTPGDFPNDETAFFGGPSFSPDGTRIAYTRRGRSAGLSVWISPAGGGSPVRLNGSEASQYAPSWSPDGRWIAYFATGGGQPRGIYKSRVGGNQAPGFVKEAVGGPRWSPDGSWISAVTSGGLELFSPDGKSARLLSKRSYDPFCWSKDGSTIYGAVVDKRTMLLAAIDIRTGAEKTIANLGPEIRFGTFAQFQNPFSLASDGKSIAATQQRNRSDIWLLEGFDAR